MTNAMNLGPRPAAHLISFARECFVDGPVVTEYVIAMAAPSYPKVFTDRAEAEKAARTFGRPFSVETRTTSIRVRWF